MTLIAFDAFDAFDAFVVTNVLPELSFGIVADRVEKRVSPDTAQLRRSVSACSEKYQHASDEVVGSEVLTVTSSTFAFEDESASHRKQFKPSKLAPAVFDPRCSIIDGISRAQNGVASSTHASAAGFARCHDLP